MLIAQYNSIFACIVATIALTTTATTGLAPAVAVSLRRCLQNSIVGYILAVNLERSRQKPELSTSFHTARQQVRQAQRSTAKEKPTDSQPV